MRYFVTMRQIGVVSDLIPNNKQGDIIIKVDSHIAILNALLVSNLIANSKVVVL